MKLLYSFLGLLSFCFLIGCDLFAVSTRTSESLSLSAELSEIVVSSNLQLEATGGVPPYVFSLENSLVMGSVDSSTGLYTAPSGATLNNILVTDSVGSVAEFLVTVKSALSLTTDSTSSRTGEVKTLTPVGGVSPYIFEILSGSGVVGSETGVFSAPWTVDTSVVQVTDAQSNTATISISRSAQALMNGTLATDSVSAGGVDGLGNIYFAGATDGAFSGFSNSGSYDAYIVKTNSRGVTEWIRQFGTSGYDKVHALAIDSSNRIYLVGETAGTLGTNTPVGSIDAFIQVYSPEGDIVWSTQLGTTSTDRAFSLAIDNTNGFLYIAGQTYGNYQGVSAGSSDLFLAQYTLNGVLNWVDQSGTSNNDAVRGVAVDPSGYVYITGTLGYASGASPSFNGISYTQYSTPSFVVKYSSSGSVLWSLVPVNGGQYPYSGYSLVADSNGGLYVAFRDDDSFINNNWGTVVVKYSTHDGSLVWANDPSENYTGYYLYASLTLDSSRNPVLVSSTYNYASEVGLYQFQSSITKMNTSTGAEIWNQNLGDIGATTLGYVAASNSDRTEFFMMGVSNGALGGSAAAGSFDPFVAKYDLNGDLK
jgi:hypothetical protein